MPHPLTALLCLLALAHGVFPGPMCRLLCLLWYWRLAALVVLHVINSTHAYCRQESSSSGKGPKYEFMIVKGNGSQLQQVTELIEQVTAVTAMLVPCRLLLASRRWPLHAAGQNSPGGGQDIPS